MYSLFIAFWVEAYKFTFEVVFFFQSQINHVMEMINFWFLASKKKDNPVWLEKKPKQNTKTLTTWWCKG